MARNVNTQSNSNSSLDNATRELVRTEIFNMFSPIFAAFGATATTGVRRRRANAVSSVVASRTKAKRAYNRKSTGASKATN